MESVIVIHPDVERRNFFYEVLSNINYKVTTLPSLKELKGALKAERPSCVIVSLSKDSGDLLKDLREVDRRIKVLALVEEEERKLLEKNFFLDKRTIFINKDLELSQLTQSVLKFLREKEMESDLEEAPKKILFKGRIMVIDDDHECCRLVTTYLNRRGYNAEGCFTGEEALIKIKASRPSIVILDVLMPGMDGLVVLKRIKEVDEAIVVLVTTGLDDEKTVKAAMKLGASGYMTKPFNFAKLEGFLLAHSLK